jgi:hypothetical protein
MKVFREKLNFSETAMQTSPANLYEFGAFRLDRAKPSRLRVGGQRFSRVE